MKAPCPSEMNISWLPFGLCGLSGRHWLGMRMAAGEKDLQLSKSHWANSIDLFSPFCPCRIRLAEQPELLCWSRNLSEPTAWGGHHPGFWRVIADEVVFLKDGFFIFVCVLSVAGFEKRSLGNPVIKERITTLLLTPTNEVPFVFPLLTHRLFIPLSLLCLLSWQVCDTAPVTRPQGKWQHCDYWVTWLTLLVTFRIL